MCDQNEWSTENPGVFQASINLYKGFGGTKFLGYYNCIQAPSKGDRLIVNSTAYVVHQVEWLASDDWLRLCSIVVTTVER